MPPIGNGDVLDRNLAQLRGLASCLVVLGRVQLAPDLIEEKLIDDALPMLGEVMLQLADEAIRARDSMTTTRQSAEAANG